ncbi:hypothetical protein E2P86_08045 [Sphingobacterium psychroaquaticum]|uniref:hypothetical protein n=1 Tax=Sphingobacterium psychroaquaticum TaxID=561061 RepID=UPI00106D0473|nr:hypothetical protein [Sphingobacterium psychroaquaticum]QBQ41108.1 hypothetical protein E2P86_08045 [Sphingobacterium psychroaquaticum]
MKEKDITKVHVCIYGHEMLKEVITRLRKNSIPFDREIHYDFLCHDNSYLVFDEEAKVVQDPTPNHSIEVDLNTFFEILLYNDQEIPKNEASANPIQIGTWVKSINQEGNMVIGVVTEIGDFTLSISNMIFYPNMVEPLGPSDLHTILHEITSSKWCT